MGTPISNRYDFILLFDVKDGNPNGDPDAGNMPRIDPETGEGLVTDVAIKRKIRNYIGLAKGNTSPYKIYVREGAVLQEQRQESYPAKSSGKSEKKDQAQEEKARAYMCEHFYDVRAFGAVMSTNKFNAGQVRGPVQLTFARSENRILPMDHAITRVARETQERAARGGQSEMGGKHTVAYGLYRAHGFVSPHFANGDSGTGFSDEDLELLWKGLEYMFDVDRSASRGEMSTRRLIVFKHKSELGNARSRDLFDLVQIKQKSDVPRSYSDFEVKKVDESKMPKGVELIYRV